MYIYINILLNIKTLIFKCIFTDVGWWSCMTGGGPDANNKPLMPGFENFFVILKKPFTN